MGRKHTHTHTHTLCGRCMCVSACCCAAAVVHPHDPMAKGRGGCRECQSPVHCGTPLHDVDTFRGTGKCRISQLYREMLPDFFFVLSSLFSRPRAGLATVKSSFFRVGNQYSECEKQQQQQVGRVYRPYRQEAISCSHVQPHILLFLITGSTILIDFLLLRFLSFFFF